MSKLAGMRRDWVQAGGGNTSVKISEHEMLIKASGYKLPEISENQGFSKVNYTIIRDYFEETHYREMMESDEQQLIYNACISGNKPSIETFLHSITDKYTLHTHPILVNVLAVRKKGMEILAGLFPDALMVGYATPGIRLAEEYFKAYKRNYKFSDVVFLKNHGLIVSGKDAREVINKTEAINDRISEYLQVDNSAYKYIFDLYNCFQDAFPEFRDIIFLSENCYIREALQLTGGSMWDYQFCPDCIVFCGQSAALMTDPDNDQLLINHDKLYGKPIIIIHNGNLYICAPSFNKASEIEDVLSFSAKVAIMNQGYKVDLLKKMEMEFLLDWDAEKYRSNMIIEG
jgi:ribulose-5-phosphate 4-epimerase/fuculose-1-phosphate aldolase